MLRNYETHQETSPARPTSATWQITTRLRSVRGTLRESLAACRQYEHLRSSGIPHDTAVRESLGMGLIPSQVLREAATLIERPGFAQSTQQAGAKPMTYEAKIIDFHNPYGQFIDPTLLPLD